MAKVTTLEWPENSSDLNLLENLFKIVKRKVADKQSSSTSVLVDTMKNVWIIEICVEYWQNSLLPCCDADQRGTFKIRIVEYSAFSILVMLFSFRAE